MRMIWPGLAKSDIQHRCCCRAVCGPLHVVAPTQRAGCCVLRKQPAAERPMYHSWSVIRHPSDFLLLLLLLLCNKKHRAWGFSTSCQMVCRYTQTWLAMLPMQFALP